MRQKRIMVSELDVLAAMSQAFYELARQGSRQINNHRSDLSPRSIILSSNSIHQHSDILRQTTRSKRASVPDSLDFVCHCIGAEGNAAEILSDYAIVRVRAVEIEHQH
jgi:hypothetical protein